MGPRSDEQFEKMRQESRTIILETALTLFGQKGYHTTSMREIAEKADVSKGLLYNYFESKKDLLKNVLEMMMEELSQILEEIEQYPEEEQLEQGLHLYFEMLKEEVHFWELVFSLAVQVDEFTFVREFVTNEINGYYNIFTRWLKAVNYPAPEKEAKQLVALLDGVAVQYILMKENFPLEEIRDSLIKKYCQNKND